VKRTSVAILIVASSAASAAVAVVVTRGRARHEDTQPRGTAAPYPRAEAALNALASATSGSRQERDADRTESLPSATTAAGESDAVTARQERDGIVKGIRESGSDDQNLLSKVVAMGQFWERKCTSAGAPTAFQRWECFKAGCFANVAHASPAELEKATIAITNSTEFSGWPGQKVRSGPMATSGGGVEATWILLAQTSE
jgi:hypothetical protein